MDHSSHKGHKMAAPQPSKSKLREFAPLIVVFAVLLLWTAVTQWLAGGFELKGAMRMFMGGFFILFSFFKFLDLKGFADSFAEYDIVAKRSRAYARAYPFIEAALGVFYLANILPVLTNVVTIVVLGVGGVGVAKVLLDKKTIRCACLGAVIKLPMTTVTLLEDVLMVVMAIVMLTLL